jgi:cyclophilin family peptidyl-prolyl cis-trans isomerase
MTHNKNSRRPAKRKSNKIIFLAVGIIAIVLVSVGAYVMLGQSSNPSNATPTPTPAPTSTLAPGTSATPSPSIDPLYLGGTQVKLHTSMGDIIIALRNDKPITTANFIHLVQQGTYNGTIFHRVMANFMIQGGDPTGTGYGDPSIPNIQDEIGSSNVNLNGTISMANTGQPNSASSQFFINVADNTHLYSTFDTSYAVFGKVISGMDVVMAVSQVATNSNDKPLTNVTIIGASIIS